MSEPRRALTAILLLCVLFPAVALGSEQAPPDAVTAPPLVPADPGPLELPSLEEVPEDAAPLPIRGLVEMLGGGLSGASLGFVAALVMPKLVPCGDEDCLGPFILGGLGGAALGLPLGVYGAGRLMGRQGGVGALGASYLGMGIGGGAALVSALAIDDEDGWSFIAVPAGALLGAIIGFELASDPEAPSLSPRSAPRRDPGPTLLLAPMAGPAPRGHGFVGGLSGRF